MSNIFRAHRDTEGKMPTRYYSDKQEKAVAKAVNGRQVPNSGAVMFSKGDVNTDLFLLECKTQTREKKTFTIHEEWFEKNKEESLFMGKDYSAVVFNFGPNKPNYYVIDECLFQTLQEYLSNEET